MSVKGENVVVVCPIFTKEEDINNFVSKNKKWIDKQFICQNYQRTQINNNFTNNQILMFGEKTKIIRNCKTNYFDYENHVLYLKSKNIVTYLKNYYLDYLNKAVFRVAEKLNLKYKEIKLINAKTRWGSCKQDKTISFNWRLIFVPIEMQYYVIIHELCHIKEMNHSQKFWNLVKNSCENYKNIRKDLKSFSYVLTLYR